MVVCKDHNGRVFDSLADLARAYGINASTLRSRLRRGVGLRSALLSRGRSTPLVDGVPLAEFCRAHGLKYAVVYHRLYRGAGRDALTAPVRPGLRGNSAPVEYQGRVYAGLSALARALGIHPATLHYRVHVKGLPVSEAVRLSEVSAVAFRGAVYRSLRDLALSFGLAYPTLLYQCKKIGVARAMEYLLRKKKEAV